MFRRLAGNKSPRNPLPEAGRHIMADESVRTVLAIFATREEAERAVEHLVQKHRVNRADVFVEPKGPENSAGTVPSGPDTAENASDGGPALHGPIQVSVDLGIGHIAAAEATLREAGARAISSR